MNYKQKLRLLWRLYETQQKLADELPWYVTQSKISHWVNGKQRIRPYIAKKFDELFLRCVPRMLTNPAFARESAEITAAGFEISARIHDELREEIVILKKHA